MIEPSEIRHGHAKFDSVIYTALWMLNKGQEIDVSVVTAAVTVRRCCRQASLPTSAHRREINVLLVVTNPDR